MGPWLDARIAEVCDANAAKLDELIATNSASRDAASAEA